MRPPTGRRREAPKQIRSQKSAADSIPEVRVGGARTSFGPCGGTEPAAGNDGLKPSSPFPSCFVDRASVSSRNRFSLFKLCFVVRRCMSTRYHARLQICSILYWESSQRSLKTHTVSDIWLTSPLRSDSLRPLSVYPPWQLISASPLSQTTAHFSTL
ncbi:hypothetical protein CDEST_08217 [Colletotrichum destructivum]|uniref:Uncharacterized protein n=1 Tax=Colletotrichum destructivum TaxID=34406 RepID=A0AAX4IJK7_9PEZI|nr:hypothetical protein CDEST_08217 [Colletotrichum destructivum]